MEAGHLARQNIQLVLAEALRIFGEAPMDCLTDFLSQEGAEADTAIFQQPVVQGDFLRVLRLPPMQPMLTIGVEAGAVKLLVEGRVQVMEVWEDLDTERLAQGEPMVLGVAEAGGVEAPLTEEVGVVLVTRQAASLHMAQQVLMGMALRPFRGLRLIRH